VAGSSLLEAMSSFYLSGSGTRTSRTPITWIGIEAAVRSPEQRTEYALVLLSKVQRTRYPSGAILDRLGRLTNLS
jgi:hypothetical protein